MEIIDGDWGEVKRAVKIERLAAEPNPVVQNSRFAVVAEISEVEQVCRPEINLSDTAYSDCAYGN